MRCHELLIDRQCFSILRNRLIKSAHLQQQLSVRVVRVGIVWNQLGIFLKSLFRTRVVAGLPVRVAKNVEGTGILGLNLSSFLVMLDRFGVFLLAKVITAKREMSALVIRVSGNQLLEVLFLFDCIAVCSRLSAENKQLLSV